MSEPGKGFIAGESVVSTLKNGDSGELILTNMRIIATSARGNVAFASALLDRVTAVRLRRRTRVWEFMPWAVIGFLVAVGVWYNVPNVLFGAVAAGALILAAAGMVVMYIARPYRSILMFCCAGGAVEGLTDGNASENVEQFVADFEAARTAFIAAKEAPKREARLRAYERGGFWPLSVPR